MPEDPAAGRTVDMTCDDALGDDDATALAGRLARRQVSAAELHAAAVERARRADQTLNAVTTWPSGSGSRAASTVAGPFRGVPTLVKDNEDLAGSPTSEGSRAMPDRPVATSSPIVGALLELGPYPRIVDTGCDYAAGCSVVVKLVS